MRKMRKYQITFEVTESRAGFTFRQCPMFAGNYGFFIDWYDPDKTTIDDIIAMFQGEGTVSDIEVLEVTAAQ